MAQNEVSVAPEFLLASGKTRDEEQKNMHLYVSDHSNYVETLCELAQQSPSCTQTLDQQATGRMDKVGQESEVAIYISGLISDA